MVLPPLVVFSYGSKGGTETMFEETETAVKSGGRKGREEGKFRSERRS